MKYIVFFGLVSCLFFSHALAQNKYFEKRHAWTTTNDGHEIIVANDTSFLIGGGTHSFFGDGLFHGFVCKSDLEGNLFDYKDYKYMDSNGLFVNWRTMGACKASNTGYAIAGRYETLYGQSDFYYYGYIMFVDENCDSTAFHTLNPDGNFSSLWDVAPTPDGQYIAAGTSVLDSINIPYLVRIDENGNKTLERTYPMYNSGEYNGFLGVVPTVDGGYVLTGIENFTDANPEDDNMILMKVDNDGNFGSTGTIDFGWFEQPMYMIPTNDGGVAISMLRGESQYPPISDYYGEGLLVKFAWDMSQEWNIEVVNDQALQSVIQLEDGDYVACGSHKFNDGTVDACLAKVSVDNGVPYIKWRRFYGGSWSDYAFGLTQSPDGGFMVVGRSDSIPVDTAYMYMIKTNCMGLLTEPEAAFEYDAVDAYNVQFINQSQFVYPDSTDGGSYLWSFGDGATSAEPHPQHTYPEVAEYEVTLTAIVCSDTSVYTQTVSTEPTGINPQARAESITVLPPSPNPAASGLPIRIGVEFPHFIQNKAVTVHLYDINGRLLHEGQQIGGGIYELPTSGLTAGIYLYGVEWEGNTLDRGKLMLF